jgi:hypothetical protein
MIDPVLSITLLTYVYLFHLQGIQWAGSIQHSEDKLSEVPWQLEALWTGGEPPSMEVCMEESKRRGSYIVSLYTLSLSSIFPELL